jgi:hypothetical protein
MKLFKLTNENKNRLADGCVLPDGQVAIAWCGEHKTHGTYPNLETFQSVQAKIPGRKIEDYIPTDDEMCLGLDTYTFHLVRDDDVTGVSGTGVVAVGCDFPYAGCVLQWTTEIKSTFWYPSIEAIKVLHGHNGKTRIVINEQ